MMPQCPNQKETQQSTNRVHNYWDVVYLRDVSVIYVAEYQKSWYGIKATCPRILHICGEVASVSTVVRFEIRIIGFLVRLWIVFSSDPTKEVIGYECATIMGNFLGNPYFDYEELTVTTSYIY